jgi:hypothetical protein
LNLMNDHYFLRLAIGSSNDPFLSIMKILRPAESCDDGSKHTALAGRSHFAPIVDVNFTCWHVPMRRHPPSSLQIPSSFLLNPFPILRSANRPSRSPAILPLSYGDLLGCIRFGIRPVDGIFVDTLERIHTTFRTLRGPFGSMVVDLPRSCHKFSYIKYWQ